jgi:hypothetical protein
MQTKPIFIGFAAAILILIVAAASFSAGLYLGQRGYVADLQYQAPQNVQGQPPVGGIPAGNAPQSGPQAGQPGPQAGQQPQGGNAPAGGPPGAPYWPPDVIGRLVTLTADSITLDTPGGPVTVAINTSTKIVSPEGKQLTAADLHEGDVIGVFGKDTAAVLMPLPPRPNAP